MRQLKRIPLIVVLWERAGFQGRKRTFPVVTDILPGDNLAPGMMPRFNEVADLKPVGFNDVTQAIGIHQGPTYILDEAAGATISFYENPNFKGREIVFRPGTISNLQLNGFENKISSWRYNPPGTRPAGLYDQRGNWIGDTLPLSAQPSQLISSIPLVAQLFNINFAKSNVPISPQEGYPVPSVVTSNHILLVEDSYDLKADFGPEFDGKANAAVVWPGPDYNPLQPDKHNWQARFYNKPLTQKDRLSGIEPTHRDFSPRERIHDVNVQVASGVFDDPLNDPPFDIKPRAVRFVLPPR